MNRALDASQFVLRWKVVAVTLTALLAAGCVPRGELDQAQTQLTSCNEERTRLEASVAAWEDRYDRTNLRWQRMQENVSEAVPSALSELNAERDRVLELIPEQVRGEVDSYLDEYFTTVMRGFEKLHDDNRGMQVQLQATRKALETVGADTRSIGVAIDDALAEEKNLRQTADSRLGEVGNELAGLIDRLTEFDRKAIHCKSCDERLRLSRKEREALTAFHSELTQGLARVQSLAGAAIAPSEDPEIADGEDAQDETTE